MSDRDKSLPPNLLHNINTGWAELGRTGSETQSEPQGSRRGGGGAALPRGRPLPLRASAGGRGRGQPRNEQNADRKCSCRNDSLHRRQTLTASPFPSPPPSRSVSEHRFRCRHCTALRRSPPGFAAAGETPSISPRLSAAGTTEFLFRGCLSPSLPLRLPPEFLFYFPFWCAKRDRSLRSDLR